VKVEGLACHAWAQVKRSKKTTPQDKQDLPLNPLSWAFLLGFCFSFPEQLPVSQAAGVGDIYKNKLSANMSSWLRDNSIPPCLVMQHWFKRPYCFCHEAGWYEMAWALYFQLSLTG